ncbi:type II 3-dehydroquinate dehydratase [Candidatus Poriferisodalis sp.]|uniref:type II 3-dehydroquinate dehydratase n=1 Tax=Candidatus Poriferisodalis sp. TaxID=3101277 RepID=UPI003B02D7FF
MPRRVVLLLSGPNLNLLGTRQPEIYGTETLLDHVRAARRAATAHGWDLEHRHSNHEGDLVDAVHEGIGRVAAIVVNPGALTHYGWSLHDALAAFEGPIVELHLSEPREREQWRHLSVVEPLACARVAGEGAAGYPRAVELAVAAAASATDVAQAGALPPDAAGDPPHAP